MLACAVGCESVTGNTTTSPTTTTTTASNTTSTSKTTAKATTTTAKKTTTAAKSDSPKTGVNGAAMPVTFLAIAGASAFAFRKKRS